MRLLKLRGTYDPKRFYKTEDTSKLPKYFQVGTVVEGAADFFSARLTKKAGPSEVVIDRSADSVPVYLQTLAAISSPALHDS